MVPPELFKLLKILVNALIRLREKESSVLTDVELSEMQFLCDTILKDTEE